MLQPDTGTAGTTSGMVRATSIAVSHHLFLAARERVLWQLMHSCHESEEADATPTAVPGGAGNAGLLAAWLVSKAD
jgi:hypothetical protein